MSKEKKLRWKPLAKDVIVVAVEGAVGDWAAYIGAVKGDNHEYEWMKVRDHGAKLRKEVAEVLFPDFKHLRWRY